MQLPVGSRILEFFRVRLRFGDTVVTNVFARKNNKTVGQTLTHRRYKHLLPVICNRYPDSMNRKLGEFLEVLKQAGDPLYLRFLNKYGDRAYCRFWMEQSVYSDRKGLYYFTVVQEVKYIGKTTNSFSSRINQGYGTISPKNCYLDGQATNCHLNSLIAKNRDGVELFVCPLEQAVEINKLERILIQTYQPEWNVALV